MNTQRDKVRHAALASSAATGTCYDDVHCHLAVASAVQRLQSRHSNDMVTMIEMLSAQLNLLLGPGHAWRSWQRCMVFGML